jgi:hypothetical protein
MSCPKDALATLKFYYSIRPNHEDTTNEKFAERAYWEVMCATDFIRDDNDVILVEDSIQYFKEEIDDLFYYQHTGSFVRAMNRMKKIKEELMAAVWHPRRIERLLELGGETTLDNFAGL